VEFEVISYGVEVTMGRGVDGELVWQVRRMDGAWPAAQRRRPVASFRW
jgi:hypothetical protein